MTMYNLSRVRQLDFLDVELKAGWHLTSCAVIIKLVDAPEAIISFNNGFYLSRRSRCSLERRHFLHLVPMSLFAFTQKGSYEDTTLNRLFQQLLLFAKSAHSNLG